MAGRLVIAGTQSGVGKTTITVGLIDALRRRGVTVQPFKVGPDYIDPTYHSLAAGRPCRNLDTWMLPAERVRESFIRAAQSVDMALVEGVMGLFDGFDYETEAGSTAQVAKLLTAPVVVVLDAAKMARSAAAMALGYQRFDAHVRLAGFIVNNVAGQHHGRGVAIAIETATGLPVLGWIPRAQTLHVPERHLGLIPTAEPGRWSEFIQAAGTVVSQHVQLDRLLTIANETAALPECTARLESAAFCNGHNPVIAVARDEAFHFIYEDNLNLLRQHGAQVAFFSPLQETTLPEGTAAIILSGGFPEVYARQLAANSAMRQAVRRAHATGLPIYAECGGLMYLTQALRGSDGEPHEMVGLLPGHCVMGERLTLGYRLAQSAADSWWLQRGEAIRGHEFHYSRWLERPASLPPAYLLLPRNGEGEPRPEGACVGNLWASYVHIHFATKPELASRLVDAARSMARGGVK